MDALGKFFRLNPGDRWLLLRALWAVGSAWVTVRLFPASVVLRKLSSDLPPLPRRQQTPGRIGWAVTAVARCIPGSKCLVQAIAGRNLLAHCGFAGAIHIGVAKDSKSLLKAHAWVEVGGQTVIGADNTIYAPLIGAGQGYRP
jgi:hypothetical protein